MSLIEARGLSRDFFVPKRSAFERTRTQTALAPTDLDIVEGSSVGIIGESGSGKSTLVRLLLGLDRPTSGTIAVGGRPVDATASARSLHWLRRETGLVFQDPYASLDPRMTAGQIVREPLWALGIEGITVRVCGRCSPGSGSNPRWVTAIRMSSRAGSGSGSPSHARSRMARGSWSATSRCRRWT